MKTRRTDLELNIETLRAIASGVSTPTHIMYKTNTNYVPNKRRLETLEQKGLIRVVNPGEPRKQYTITKEGLSTLESFSVIEEFLGF